MKNKLFYLTLISASKKKNKMNPAKRSLSSPSFFFSLGFLFFSFFLISCQNFPSWNKWKRAFENKKENKERIHALKQSEAEERAQILSKIQYQIFVSLDRIHPYYSGTTELEFHWVKNKDFLRIDFFDGDIEELIVNSNTLIKKPSKKANSLKKVQQKQKIQKINQAKRKKKQKENKLYWYNKRALFLSPSLLVPGKNHAKIQYKKSYSSGSQGFIRFQDKKDKKVYLHTKFQPYAANEFFPCFDQPDLKATYTLRVEAPKEWKVISSMREYKIEKLDSKKQNRRLWHFSKSFRFSTYLFSLHAGPYRMWQSKTSLGLPLRLFSRQSVAKYVHPKIWFKFTRLGLKFFPNHFSKPYPYSKYDQLIVPNHLSLAMENVGAVTFSEYFLFRDPPSSQNQFFLALVLFHEMAHMWFGNLVTMKWWDDLWLNESFASYIASVAAEKILKDKFSFSSWEFISSYKNYSYFQDDSDFTHPVISSNIKTTALALSQFDSITYGKGEAVIRQLVSFLGENNFLKGLKNYLDHFHEKNAIWKDLLDRLSRSSSSSLSSWSQQWLQSTGFNSIQAHFKCKEGKISELFLKQKVETGQNILRPHQLQVALLNFEKEKNEFVLKKKLDVTIKQKTLFLNHLKGFSCPDLVYPNWNEKSYIRVYLDPKSLKNTIENINHIPFSFLRLLLSKDILTYVKNASLSLRDYSSLFLNQLKEENNLILLKHLLRNLPSLYQYYPKDTEKEKHVFFDFVSQIEKILWNRIKTTKNREKKLLWKTFFIQSARTPYALDRLYDLLNGRIKIQSLVFKEPHERWEIIKKLSEFQHKDIEKIAQKESLKDKSFIGKMGFLAASALKPEEENKKFWLKRVLDEKKSELNYKEKAAVLKHLYPKSQEHLKLKYKNFFKDVIKVNENQKNPSIRPLPFISLLSSVCKKSYKEKIDSFLQKEGKNLQKRYKRNLHFQSKHIDICLKIRRASF